jgi:hypothetical protein
MQNMLSGAYMKQKKARLLSGLFVSITTSDHQGSDTPHTDHLHPSSVGLLFW